MTQHLVFLLLGLGNGAVFGALAVAVVLTYRSSGVLNFATGAIALYTAYVYGFLRQGELLLLVPGLPKTIDIGDPLGLWPAMVIALAMAALLGLILYVLIFRPLRTAPLVARAVAALGVSLVIGGLVATILGTDPVTVDPIFPTDVWRSGDLRVSADRLYFAATIVAIAIVLSLIFRFTKFGLATRAAAESERGAYVSGVSPDRIAAYNWMLSSAVAGLSGILIAPIVPLVPVAYTLFIVPALAAAIVARFEFVVVAVLAGLAIGALQSEAQYLSSMHSWLPSAGLPELIPLVLILLVLVVRARALPARGAVILKSLGRAPRPRHLVATTVLAVVAVVALVVLQDRYRMGLITSLIMAVIALSIVVVTGYAGQVSLAQLTIAGVAGFALGPIGNSLHVPFPLAPLLAAIAAAALGVVVGLPALRIRGLTVAVATFAMAFALEAFWFRNLDLVGSAGTAIPTPSLFGWDLGIGAGHDYPRVRFGLMCLFVLVVVGVSVALLRRSRLGSQMLAVRANERSAAAAGVNVTRVKILAFAIAAFIAGLGGALLAYQQQTITFDSFSALGGLVLFGTVYLAGVTSVSGGLLAGIIAANGLLYIAVDEIFTVSGWYSVIASVALIFTVILNPEGIVGPVHAVLVKRTTPAGTATVMGSSAATRSVRRREDREFDPAADPVFELRNVSVHYGGVVAVDDVSIAVPRGAIVGLIGPNGAGKTTLIDAISGFTPHEGAVSLDGHSIDDMVAHKRIRAGLGRTFQAIELYDDLSVGENVKVGLTAAGRHRSARRAPDTGNARLDTVFELLGLAEVRERPAGELSHGQRQLVSIARALAGAPEVLLLDEPAGGLDTTESQWLAERLRDIRDSGITIVMIDHDMNLVLGLCDWIHVLNFGQVIASGPPAAIRADQTVAQAYLGSMRAEGAML
ncbi:branched-chain amino acid ABC transporter permease/ATP-binding protein [Nocardia sp. NBC_00565]|uniref:branched-chain amino acid ABC transporter permease/ATP-binding protein n=1 Tax=Nocardia sp. NBC_00565 TaxID=2975993 RepID=UPI002E81A1C6|nr:branched-chain amino acid ABC transporter permease/ATP-binding protein [Nocardia sp. NBC_00565]WUC05760.1 branched-chain amino acid ABC transporter permease/ATP-binding protein [Nocardia sp. NBC_00565]